MDCSPPGSSVHGILQARILEWVAISFSRGSSQLMDQTHISYIPCIPLTWTQEISQEELHTSCRRNLPISQDQIIGGGGLVAESCPTLATPWTVARQAPLSMGFSRPEYWSGFLFPSPGDLTDPGIELRSPALQADALPTELCGKPL